MRDNLFIALHRGGSLSKENHRLLMKWAQDCARHVLPLLGKQINEGLSNALIIARKWETGKATVGDARNASLDAIAVANEFSNPVDIAIARSVGHAVATAHMADHSLRASEYALKAIKISGRSVDAERNWQEKHIPPEIKELVLSARKNNSKFMK